MKLVFSRQIFEKYSNIKFHENPSSGSRVVPSGRTDMKLTVAFRNFANAPKTVQVFTRRIQDKHTHQVLHLVGSCVNIRYIIHENTTRLWCKGESANDMQKHDRLFLLRSNETHKYEEQVVVSRAGGTYCYPHPVNGSNGK
jgi:hypothetical protein